MDTNALLSIAFSIVANFTNVVPVPPEAVPQTTNDLAAYSIGRRYFPLDMYLRHKRGTEFWIQRGAVQLYHYPSNYFSLQDPRLIVNFVDEETISSNVVAQMATNIVRRLIKTYDPLTNVTPVVKRAAPFKGRTVPFYRVRWPDPVNPPVFSIAEVEVDASAGRVVSLQILGPAFGDSEWEQKIKNIVFADTNLYAAHLRQISNLVHGAESPRAPPVSDTNLFPNGPLFK